MRRWWVILIGVLGLLAVVAAVIQFTGMSYASLRDDVRAHGAHVEENGVGAQPFPRGADHRLTVNGANVDVFEYWTFIGASLDAARISRDGSTFNQGIGPLGGSAVTVDFVAPPHWFHSGRVIVLYVGYDRSVMTLLGATLGPQIAGL
ncbi:MAG TPA: hypothetical protein VF808_11615 [Ktedonobacterales bacterium]